MEYCRTWTTARGRHVCPPSLDHSAIPFLQVLLAASLVVCGAHAQEPGEELETVVVAAPGEADARLQNRLKAFFKSVPEGTKVRVTVGRYFDMGRDNSTDDFEPYVNSVVPLDERGKPHGDEEFTKPNNHSVYRTLPWKNGVLDGVERRYEGWGRDRWVEVEIPWVKGKLEGVRRTFHSPEHLRTETTYKNDVADGPSRTFDAEGKLLRESIMKKGKRHGVMTDYWPGTDQVKRVIDYRDGLVHGVMREYYANAQLKREMPFQGDLMHGEEKHFEVDGTVSRLRFWIKGEQVPQDEFKKRF